ncbi:MAG: hypothetical protein JSR17_13845 [Proteobacteria bacterium]|nr:hypothetical protein [Pseudomonadota bacterium]
MKAKVVQEYLGEAIKFFERLDAFFSDDQNDIQDLPQAMDSFKLMSQWMRQVARENAQKSKSKLARFQQNHPPIIELVSIRDTLRTMITGGDSPRKYVTSVEDEAAYEDELDSIADKTRDFLLRAQEVLNAELSIAQKAVTHTDTAKHKKLVEALKSLKTTCDTLLKTYASVSVQPQTKSWFARALHQGVMWVQVNLELKRLSGSDKERVNAKRELQKLNRNYEKATWHKPTAITKRKLALLGDGEMPTSDMHSQHFPKNLPTMLNAFSSYMDKTKFKNISPSGIQTAITSPLTRQRIR